MKKLSTIIILALLAVGTVCAQTYSKELEERAANGDKLAMMELGCCYQTGAGIQQDYAKAMAWYLKVLEDKARLSIGAEWTIGYLYDGGAKAVNTTLLGQWLLAYIGIEVNCLRDYIEL